MGPRNRPLELTSLTSPRKAVALRGDTIPLPEHLMQQAVFVASTRTAIGKAFRGALNATHGADMVAPLIQELLSRTNLDPARVEEVVLGTGYPEGATGGNLARASALRAGLPDTTAGAMVSRFCASGLEAVSLAAARIARDGVPAMIAGGVESISLAASQPNRTHLRNPWLAEHRPELYHTMIETADLVAARYGVSREMQDAFSLESQKRTARAQETGIFKEEILPLRFTRSVTDKASGETRLEEVLLTQDEGNRPSTTLDGLAGLAPVREGGFITAGNASQLSDGAAALLMMSEEEASRQGLQIMGCFKGFASAGCGPEEMGIGPIFAIPRLLERHGLSIDDIDLWEINEAFASQAVYCQQKLGIPSERLNVNGGAISIGHPFGMSGARMVGHALYEGARRGARYGVVSMCVAGGMGCAALLEFR